METTILLLTICLCIPRVIKSDSSDWKQQGTHSCNYNSKCYNPYWCEAMLSSRKCSNKILHRKLECLTDILNERSKACELLTSSSDDIGIFTKNLSSTVSKMEDLSKELIELNNTCTTTKNGLSELQKQQEQVRTWSEKLETMNKASEELQVKYDSLDTKIGKLNEGKRNSDMTLESLKGDAKSVDNRLTSIDSTIQSKQEQMEDLNKELIELKNTCTATKNGLSELQKQQEQVRTWSDKLDTMNKTSEELHVKYDSLDTKIGKLNEDKRNTDTRLESLKGDTKSIVNRLILIDSTIQSKQKQMDQQLSEIFKQNDNNIQSSEQKLKELYRKEFRQMDEKVSSLEYNWTTSEDKFNTTLLSLNDTVAYNKENSSQNLYKLSEEVKNGLENLSSATRTLDISISELESKLEKDIEVKTERILHESKQEISDKSEEINSRMSGMSREIDIEMENINSYSKTVSNSLTETEKRLESKIKTETNDLRSDINRKVENLDTSLKTLTEDSKTESENINTKILEMLKRIELFKSESDQNIEDTKKALTKMVQENMSNTDSKVDGSLKEMDEKIEELKREIRQLIKVEVDQLSQQTIQVNQTVTKQKEIVDIIYPNTFNKEMFIIAFLMLVVLLAINYAIVYMLVKRTSPSQPSARTETTDSVTSKTHTGEEPHSPVEVFNRLTFPQSLPDDMSGPLRDSVAVISFYEDAQKHHTRLMKSVVDRLPESHDVTVKYHVVRRHENIPGIPRSKLCIMFVEFSERHVIIEEPGLGLGDLKRKTASFINRIGACHVIVYVRDPGSKHLKSTDLFNNAIHCAKSQPELKALSKHGRFLSIYDKFTDSQIECLIDIITANLGHTGTRNRFHLSM